jgi:hypothetical protein
MIDTDKAHADYIARNPDYPDKRSITEEECGDIWLGHKKWRDLDDCECEEKDDTISGLRHKIKETR